MQTVLERGQLDGSIRLDVKPIDVYINMVGLCNYHVAHHAGYLAAGFEQEASRSIHSQECHQQRKQAIVESCWRYVTLPSTHVSTSSV